MASARDADAQREASLMRKREARAPLCKDKAWTTYSYAIEVLAKDSAVEDFVEYISYKLKQVFPSLCYIIIPPPQNQPLHLRRMKRTFRKLSTWETFPKYKMFRQSVANDVDHLL